MAMVDGKTGSGFRVITRMLVTLAPPHARWLEGLLMELTNDIGRCAFYVLIGGPCVRMHSGMKVLRIGYGKLDCALEPWCGRIELSLVAGFSRFETI